MRIEFEYDGGGLAKGGAVTLFVDGGEVGEDQTEAIVFSADEVQADDRYVCEVDGGAYAVNGTPPVGRVTWSGDFTVSTAERGTVMLAQSAQ